MKLKVMYCPFPDATLIGACERIAKSHNSTHTLDQFDKKVLTPGKDALKGVGMFQQVYIVAHGSAGQGSIYDDGGAPMTVGDLAKQMKAQGLTNSIRKVKLYCCNGGSNGHASTAKQLKAAMLLAGFNNVSTYGYTLQLDQGNLTDEGSKEAYADANAAGVSAKSVRVKF